MQGSEKKSRRKLWNGLTSVFACLLAFAITGASMVDIYRTDIDKFLGTKSTELVTTGEISLEDLYTYQSDYTNTRDLLHAIADLGERMSEEGTVLLKNNGALPLTDEETGRVTLLGFSSYHPVMGGQGGGSALVENKGTDADTVDFVEALETKGFIINPSIEQLYRDLLPYYEAVIEVWGVKQTVSQITPPRTDGTYSDREPSQEEMETVNPGWKDSLRDYNVMIITIARGAGENYSYVPGEAGVNPEQHLHQTDPLGLSDDERDLISAAVAEKEKNGGKVIVILNNGSAMEVQEIEDNEGVDAILEVGMPGGYGFYGVADILSGSANPSGHLSDTYAVKNASAPSAQNYGNFLWADSQPIKNWVSGLLEAENIYTGYKYYETRYADMVMGQGNADSVAGSSDGEGWEYRREVTYPFGFGLSYTSFEQKITKLTVDLQEKCVTAEISVTNIGNREGKDVVQLYVQTPYTIYDREHLVEKAGVQLLDFEKTGMLQPGASETVTIKADMQYMTSWDSMLEHSNGEKGGYILDDGTYYFSIGNGAHEAINNILAAQGYSVNDGMTDAGDSSKVEKWNLSDFDGESFAFSKNGTAVTNQLSDIDLNYWEPGEVTYLSRADWEGTWPKTYDVFHATEDMAFYLVNDIYEISPDHGEPSEVVFGADNGLTLANLKGVSDIDAEEWTRLMDQITLEECMLRVGFGGTSTKEIESIGSPEAIQNDGPNGIYSYKLGTYANTDLQSGDPCAVSGDDPNLEYTFATMGTENLIGQTWSKELVEEYGRICGNYSLWSNLTIWWGVGVNLHRSPYNARNHEYFSEDSVLTAFLAAAEVEGAAEYGLIAAPKHFCFNDTEMSRYGLAVFMTEQQAREGELRATQASVENANALGIMTSFTRVGVTPCNAHTGLMMNILHKEWGFKGLITEDYILNNTYSVLKEGVMNGLTMTCVTGDNDLEALRKQWRYWTVENVSQDADLLRALKQSMKWQAYALANSNAMDGYAATTHTVRVRTWYDNALTALTVASAAGTIFCLISYFRSVFARKKEER